MNMISTGAFQTEMDASNRADTLVSKFVSAWEKKNAKVARAGGVSLMALSLAACGSDDSTTTTSSTSTSTTTTTTTTVTPVTQALTVGVDSVTGTSAADTITAARADTVNTWNSADTISGGDGADTFTAVINANVTPGTNGITGVETITLTSIGGNTIDFSSATASFITGVTSLTNLGSTGAVIFDDMTSNPEMSVNNVGSDTTFSMNNTVLAGTSDTATINLTGVTGSVAIGTNADVDGGYETLVVNATGAASDLGDGDVGNTGTNTMGTTATTVTVAATAALDLGSTAGFFAATTFSAAGSTAGVTAVFDDFDAADGVTAAITTAKSITGGDGADSFTVSAFEAADMGNLTIDGGKGNDTIDLGGYAESTMTVTGGDGTDTLVLSAELAAANATHVSGFETLHQAADQNMSLMTGSTATISTVRLTDGIAAITNATDAVTTLQIANSANANSGAASLTRLVDGTANSITVATTNAVSIATLDLADEETVTINTTNGAFTTATDVTSADITSLIVAGSGTVDTSALVGNTLLATVDATGLTGAAGLTVTANASTTALTLTVNSATSGYTGVVSFVSGSGGDTLNGTANIDTLNGGGGSDTIVGNGGADNIDGDGGNDTLTGGGGVDAFTVGEGSDTISDFVAGTGASADTITLDLSGIEALSASDLVNLDDAGSTANNSDLAFFSTDGVIDLDNVTANDNIIVISDVEIADHTALKTALAANGSKEITFGHADWAVGDSFLVMYDNGTNSYLTNVEVTGDMTTDSTMTTAQQITTDVITFTGISDVTTIVEAQYLTMTA
jgi:hypothetical protein